MTGAIEEALRAAAADGAWTQASVAVVRHGRLLGEARLGAASVYDVASVTKVATAALALAAFEPSEPIAWLGLIAVVSSFNPDPRGRECAACCTNWADQLPITSMRRSWLASRLNV